MKKSNGISGVLLEGLAIVLSIIAFNFLLKRVEELHALDFKLQVTFLFNLCFSLPLVGYYLQLLLKPGLRIPYVRICLFMFVVCVLAFQIRLLFMTISTV